MTTIIHR